MVGAQHHLGVGGRRQVAMSSAPAAAPALSEADGLQAAHLLDLYHARKQTQVCLSDKERDDAAAHGFVDLPKLVEKDSHAFARLHMATRLVRKPLVASCAAGGGATETRPCAGGGVWQPHLIQGKPVDGHFADLYRGFMALHSPEYIADDAESAAATRAALALHAEREELLAHGRGVRCTGDAPPRGVGISLLVPPSLSPSPSRAVPGSGACTVLADALACLLAHAAELQNSFALCRNVRATVYAGACCAAAARQLAGDSGVAQEDVDALTCATDAAGGMPVVVLRWSPSADRVATLATPVDAAGRRETREDAYANRLRRGIQDLACALSVLATQASLLLPFAVSLEVVDNVCAEVADLAIGGVDKRAVLEFYLERASELFRKCVRADNVECEGAGADAGADAGVDAGHVRSPHGYARWAYCANDDAAERASAPGAAFEERVHRMPGFQGAWKHAVFYHRRGPSAADLFHNILRKMGGRWVAGSAVDTELRQAQRIIGLHVAWVEFRQQELAPRLVTRYAGMSSPLNGSEPAGRKPGEVMDTRVWQQVITCLPLDKWHHPRTVRDRTGVPPAIVWLCNQDGLLPAMDPNDPKSYALSASVTMRNDVERVLDEHMGACETRAESEDACGLFGHGGLESDDEGGEGGEGGLLATDRCAAAAMREMSTSGEGGDALYALLKHGTALEVASGDSFEGDTTVERALRACATALQEQPKVLKELSAQVEELRASRRAWTRAAHAPPDRESDLLVAAKFLKVRLRQSIEPNARPNAKTNARTNARTKAKTKAKTKANEAASLTEIICARLSAPSDAVIAAGDWMVPVAIDQGASPRQCTVVSLLLQAAKLACDAGRIAESVGDATTNDDALYSEVADLSIDPASCPRDVLCVGDGVGPLLRLAASSLECVADLQQSCGSNGKRAPKRVPFVAVQSMERPNFVALFQVQPGGALRRTGVGALFETEDRPAALWLAVHKAPEPNKPPSYCVIAYSQRS